MTVLYLNAGENRFTYILLLIIISFFTTETAAGTGTDSVKAKRSGAKEDYSSWDGIKNTIMSKFYSKFGIFPSTDDPLYLNETSMAFDNDFICGNISVLNGTMVGLSKLQNDINVNIFSQKATIKVSVARLRLTGRYNADGFISLQMIEDAVAKNIENGEEEKSDKSSSILQSSRSNSNSGFDLNSNSDSDSISSGFHGNGNIIALVTGVSGEVSCQLFMNVTSGKLAFTQLDADISFKSVQVNATNMRIDESPVDWNKVSRAIKPNFDRIWQNKKDDLLSSILQEVNENMNLDLKISTIRQFMTKMVGRKWSRRAKSNDSDNNKPNDVDTGKNNCD